MSDRSLFHAAEVGSPTLNQVLVVDDSAVYRKLIGDHLRSWGFAVILAKSGSEAWEILEQPDSPKLVLLDWVLPDLEGTELCQRIRQAGSGGRYVYIIQLTSKEGHQHMLDAMKAGADDYLGKPFDEMELKARLLVGKRILDLQEELVSARESMRHAATHDSLTGLMNRGEILALLERELERGRREKKPVGVLLGDIDHFKSVNDSFGHLFGDEALREIGHRLRADLRIYDGVGRYGGEEFLMVLPNCDLPNALLRGNHIRENVGHTPVVCSGKKKFITMSIGVAISACTGKDELEGLLSQADAGLYAAKEKGRDCIEFFRPAKETSSRPRKTKT